MDLFRPVDKTSFKRASSFKTARLLRFEAGRGWQVEGIGGQLRELLTQTDKGLPSDAMKPARLLLTVFAV